MKNYVQPGDTVTISAPDTIDAGEIVQIGALIGIAATDAAIGDPLAIAVSGVFDLAKGSDVFATGDEVEAAGGEVVPLTSGTVVGVIVADAAAGDATARVRLAG
ncbi:MAG: capsid cement protein [Pseudomonadota bacterium]